ncbi:hypothetical protein ANN_19544 [Periplaneta americana]|uniref:Fatty acid desaturase domain-containing protein n=1 Tax=Periplaneta americana TaxID=6978 RepID=A0ABQ8SAU4_PERAM|nr:hypothetical protein ANN_19544 [Periplaneta americana]
MARPQVADRGDGLQIWRVAANILNKQSWTADKGGPPAWGLGEGLTTHHRKKQLVTNSYSKPRNRTDSLARPQQRNKHATEPSPGASTCRLSNELDIPRTTVWRVLRFTLHKRAYHLQVLHYLEQKIMLPVRLCAMIYLRLLLMRNRYNGGFRVASSVFDCCSSSEAFPRAAGHNSQEFSVHIPRGNKNLIYFPSRQVAGTPPTRRIIPLVEQEEKLLSSILFSKNLKVRIYKTVILSIALFRCETWTLTLREEHRLRVFEKKVLRKIFGAKRDEVTGEWRKLHNAELHALYSSPDIIRNIKSRRLRWAGHVAHMGESRNASRVLVGRPEGKSPLGSSRSRWEDDIDGFYLTLKRRVMEQLKRTPIGPTFSSTLIIDVLCSSALFFAVVAAATSNYMTGALSGFLLALTVIAAHNFFHQKDNFRMYYFDLSLMSSSELGFCFGRDWRISHALSHHLYPNSLLDLELSMFEPVFQFLPDPSKQWWARYGPMLYAPFIYSGMFISQIILSTESYPAFAHIGLRKNPGKKPRPGNLPRPGIEPGPPGVAARRADRYSTGVDSTDSYPAFAHVGLRENPGKNLNQRMDGYRLPKKAINYKPKGQRDQGRPMKNGATFEAGTGNCPYYEVN